MKKMSIKRKSFSTENKANLRLLFSNILPKTNSDWEDIADALKSKFTIDEIKEQVKKMDLKLEHVPESPQIINAIKTVGKIFKTTKRKTPPKGTVRRVSLEENVEVLIEHFNSQQKKRKDDKTIEEPFDEDDEFIREAILSSGKTSSSSTMCHFEKPISKRVWTPKIYLEEFENIGDDFSIPDHSAQEKYRMTFIAKQYARR